jgi:hypothetical protein
MMTGTNPSGLGRDRSGGDRRLEAQELTQRSAEHGRTLVVRHPGEL